MTSDDMDLMEILMTFDDVIKCHETSFNLTWLWQSTRGKWWLTHWVHHKSNRKTCVLPTADRNSGDIWWHVMTCQDVVNLIQRSWYTHSLKPNGSNQWWDNFDSAIELPRSELAGMTRYNISQCTCYDVVRMWLKGVGIKVQLVELKLESKLLELAHHWFKQDSSDKNSSVAKCK